MAQVSFAQVAALQHEKVRPKLELLYQKDNTLWAMIEDKTEKYNVAGRPSRIPIEILAGTKFAQANVSGGDLGLGGGIDTEVLTLTPVYFSEAIQYTKETEITTNSSEKAITDFVDLQMKRAMDQFRTNMDAVIQGDSSNTLDTVVSASGSVITVNNANQFYDGQDILVYSSLGGTNRTAGGAATVLSVDAGSKQITLTAAIPGGTTTGDLLLVNGSSGAAGAGINGVKTFQVQSNVGTLLGLNRALFPGKLSTPHVNANSLPLTPAMGRRSLAAIQQALGVDAPEDLKLIYHMNLDMVAAWENIGLAVAQVQQQALPGSNSIDMLKASAPKTFAGRPLVSNIHAAPGRIDGLCLSSWGRVMSQKLDFIDWGGQTLFPTYGASGGLNASTISYLWMGVNLYNANPRAGVYIDNVPIPTGY
jgi:hypothetical protein